MLKFVILPSLGDDRRTWPERLAQELPEYEVVVAHSDDDARREIADADAAFGWVPPDLLPLAGKLRWLMSPQIAPTPKFYYRELVEHPVTVTNPRGTFNDHISQHIMMVVLGLARGLPYYMAAQQQGLWAPDASQSQYIELSGATALIVGVGGIGAETAKLCNAFGMKVIGVDARWELEVASIEKHPPEALDTLLPQAEFVIVSVPHTPATEGMWHAARFQLMKNTAYFINVGRGLTTKLDDLVAALEKGDIAGCALDVYEIEPLPKEHALWTMPNVILTPHISGMSGGNIFERQFQLLLDNARRFAAGEKLHNIVDKAVWY